MSFRGLLAQTVAIPLAAGLSQKMDVRALEAPGLSKCVDAEFDEIGGIQTRKPYAAKGLAIAGGGAIAAADVRRVVENGGELLLFSKDAVYAWSEPAQAWALKGTHLATKVSEAARFVSTGDQVYADRAELAGYVLVSWHEIRGGNTYGYVAAYDATTGAVTMAPRELAGFQYIRLVALDTKILLIFYDGITGHYCYALDPANPAAALGGAATTVIGSNAAEYDAVKVPNADQAVIVSRRNPSTSYEVTTMTAGLVRVTATKARTAGLGPIACAVDPTGTYVQVVRYSAGVVGDLIALAGLGDVFVNQAIGTVPSAGAGFEQLTCAYRSVQDGGFYRAYVFWSQAGAAAADQSVQVAWVSTGNTLGAQDVLLRRADINSRAFERGGKVFVWLGFSTASTYTSGSGQNFSFALQNTYFLFRDDVHRCAKAVVQRAGGPGLLGWLPGVQALGGDRYAWCGASKRKIEIGGAGQRRDGYAARAPQEIVIQFDSNEARRTTRMGGTLYITGGEVLQYDGVQLTEVGFAIYPHTLALFPGAAGAIPNGTYVYKQTLRWENAAGDVDRSTTATNVGIVLATGPKKITLTYVPIYTSSKLSRPIAIETWRTQVNPTADAPFYRVSSSDPGVVAGDNAYIENFTGDFSLVAAWNDNLIDADITANEAHPENGAILENLAPPPATIIAATADRMFLAGVAGDTSRIWYSKLRGDGEVASFHDALTITVPRAGGAITALAFVNETLVAFCERAIYALPGDGFDNVGGGANFGPARALSLDVGAVNAESVVLIPDGLLFKSSKGWYLVNRGWGVEYVGGPIADYDAETVQAAHVVDAQHQVRILTSSRLLVLDYLVKQWGEWTLTNGVSAAMWGGKHVYVSSVAGVLQQRTDFVGIDYGLDIETAWIPMGQVQGFGRVWKVMLLGEYRGAHGLLVRLARNYAADGTYFQTKLWTPSPTTVGGPLQIEQGPSIQENQALKIRFTAKNPTNTGAPTTEALKVTSLALELGLERGLNRIPAAQRQ